VITLLVPSDVAAGQRQPVADAEAHHLRVRRAAAGDEVALRDGAGLVGAGRLALAGRDWLVEVTRIEHHARPAPMWLAVGAGDRDRFGWLAEKAAELGVTDLVPLETERTAGVASRVRDGQLDRIRRQALEAVKQCGVAWAPAVHPPEPLAAFLARPAGGQRWLATADGAPPPAVLDQTPVTVIVGPEGGLAPAEQALVRGAGYRAVGLAPAILRFETAALAAAAAITTARLRGQHGEQHG
jgi:16S rRNA (uracil1498-N3)-methyltransferase